jgi:hypothetical protein
MQCKYILQILGPLALSLTRLCILLFSRRSSTGTKNTRIINNVLVTMGLLWGVVFSLVFAFQCAPVSAMWTPFESNASRGCIDQRAAEIAFAASDIALVVALVVSVSSLLQVKPSRREEAIALVGASILGLRYDYNHPLPSPSPGIRETNILLMTTASSACRQPVSPC